MVDLVTDREKISGMPSKAQIRVQHPKNLSKQGCPKRKRSPDFSGRPRYHVPMILESDGSSESLIEAVYPELREMAARLLRQERPGHTLQRTALVHEAFMRLFRGSPLELSSLAAFLSLAAHQMRHVLIDYARKRRSLKAGGQFTRVSLCGNETEEARDRDSLLALDEALERLRELDPRALSVVELKFFAGFTNAETARILDVSEGSIEQDWQFARSWLYGTLTSVR